MTNRVYQHPKQSKKDLRDVSQYQIRPSLRMTSAENDDREIRIALIGPNARVIFVQTSTQLIHSTCSTDFILLTKFLSWKSQRLYTPSRIMISIVTAMTSHNDTLHAYIEVVARTVAPQG